MKQEILNLRNEGATIIFSTHNMESVEELCDHISLINKSEKILDGEINSIRSQFKSNTFEITYLGDFKKINSSLDQNFQILNHSENSGLNNLTVQYMSGNSNNDLLNILIPKIEIVSFNELIPSMNDVFIKVVESSNKS
jgi:ABC-2 type transport system ATP-binding protein